MPYEIESALGSVVLTGEDGAGNVNVEIPRAGVLAPDGDGSSLTGSVITDPKLNNLTGATVSASDPTSSDNADAAGHLWINSTSGETFICTDATSSATAWGNVGDGSTI